MLAAMPAEDAAFVKAWLLLDEQAVPAVYQLRPSFEAAEPEYWAAMKILQRHGQASFPDKFSQEEHKSMLAAMQAGEAALVKNWFELDKKADHAMYHLRPESGKDNWWAIFVKLQALLRKASQALEDLSRRQVYEISVTHEEALNGMLTQSISEQQKAKCFFFSRPIVFPPKPDDKAARMFYDVVDEKEFDKDASNRLEELRNQVSLWFVRECAATCVVRCFIH